MAYHGKKVGGQPGAAAASEVVSPPRAKVDPTETARRAAALERVQAGEISNAEAATELGINLGTWGAWKSGYVKRTGVIPAPIVCASVKPRSIPTGRPAADIAKFVARVEELERFGRELRERVREIVALVERWLG